MTEGTRLFGPGFTDWRFVCPQCGHVQKIGDFRPYQARGAIPDSARQTCIGRFTGSEHGLGKPGQPCDYTAHGLIQLAPIRVIDGDKELHCFDFDRSGGTGGTS